MTQQLPPSAPCSCSCVKRMALLLLLLLLLLVTPALAAAAEQPPSTKTVSAIAFPPIPAASAQQSAATQQAQKQQYSEPEVLTAPPAAVTLPPHPPHPPQRVAQVLLGLYQNYAGPMIKAAQNLLSHGLQQAEPSPLQLPQCEQTSVLLDSGHFPGAAWSELKAEQQALHPINMVMIQLAYMAYRPLVDVTSCLTGMGADLSTLRNITLPVVDYGTSRSAYVFRAGKERVFVLFRGSSDTDLVINIACRQEQPARELFGLGAGPQVMLHRGYWKAWQTLEPEVLAAVQSLLAEVPSKEVYVVGHSLGAAMGSIAALRMNAVLPRGVAGAFLFAAPRAGNAAWAAAYNKQLQHKTVRYSNYLDFAVRVPATQQSCSLGSMSLGAETGWFEYAHVGRSVLMCPEKDTGLTQFRIAPQGSEGLDCFGNDEVDATAATHQLGSYFDAWRRGHLKYTGATHADDIRVRAVLCQGCVPHTGARFRMEQFRCPARAGGPVTCTVDATCTNDVAFTASLSVGNITAARPFSNLTSCNAHMCTKVGDLRQ